MLDEPKCVNPLLRLYTGLIGRRFGDVRFIAAGKATIIVTGGFPTMTPIRLERFEAGVRQVIAFNDAFNRHDVSGMMQLMSDDCVFENTAPAPDGRRFQGKEAVTQFWQSFFAQSTQAHIKIEEAFGFGNRVVMRWRYDWEDGEGKPGHVRGVDLFRIQSRLICEKLSYVKG